MGNDSRFYFVLIATAAAIGIGNIWLYPYFTFKSTGLFFVPYFIALILLGVPLLMLEFSIGQYFNKDIVDIFASIRKWFSSIGWLMLFNAFIVMSFYAVVLAWHIIYFFVSFGLQFRYDAKNYFLNNVLQSSNLSGFASFSLPVFIAMIMAWLIIFFFIRNGFESIKRGFLVALPILIVLMFFFLIYSLKLEHALTGIYALVRPNLRGLLSLKVWIASFSLAVLSMGLSFGIMHTAARKTDKGFIVGNSFIVATFELVVSIAISFILFGILGFLNFKQIIDLKNLGAFDFGLAFTVLAQALPFFYKPTLLSILFFVFLVLFFVLGAASLAYAVMDILVHKFNTKHFSAAVIVSGLGFLFGLLFAVKPGFYIMDIVEHFIYYSILIALLLECLAAGWFYDSEIIADFINHRSILKIGRVWRFFIKYIIPAILLLLIFFQLKSDFYFGYKNYPWWALLVFGVGTVALPLIAAFLMPQKLLDRKTTKKLIKTPKKTIKLKTKGK